MFLLRRWTLKKNIKIKEKVDKIREKEDQLSKEMDIEKGNIKIHKTISEILKKEISLYDEGKCQLVALILSEHFVNLRSF
jgi:hypothetical protein